MKDGSIIEFFKDKLIENCIIEQNKQLMGAASLLAKNCFFCNKKFDRPNIMTITERRHTQNTSMGGNEETYDVNITIATCPYCRGELKKEVGNRVFVSKGWV